MYRLLIPGQHQDQHYCHQLCHTFTAYCFSLIISSLLGTFLLLILQIRSRVVSLITLLVGGTCNYQILQYVERRSTMVDPIKIMETV